MSWLTWSAVAPSRAGNPDASAVDWVVVDIPRLCPRVLLELDSMLRPGLVVASGAATVVEDSEEGIAATVDTAPGEVLDTRAVAMGLLASHLRMRRLALVVVGMQDSEALTVVGAGMNVTLEAQQAATANR